MTRLRTSAEITKQLQTVGDKLESATLPGTQRLALLRRQAQLGDERDARIDQARRAALTR